LLIQLVQSSHQLQEHGNNIRRTHIDEHIGEPDEIKRIFLSSATGLRRERYFQGAGLIDLMRAIQSV
jgi:hypothetical protein